MNAGVAMTKRFFRRCSFLALGLVACAATAAPPREIFITKEVPDLYRVSSGIFYIKTIGCTENVYGDRAALRFNISGKGGMLLFRNGRQCVIDKFLEEVESSKVQTKPTSPF